MFTKSNNRLQVTVLLIFVSLFLMRTASVANAAIISSQLLNTGEIPSTEEGTPPATNEVTPPTVGEIPSTEEETPTPTPPETGEIPPTEEETPPAAPIPEPTSMAMIGIGLAGMAIARLKKLKID